jgi:hypothetical protein
MQVLGEAVDDGEYDRLAADFRYLFDEVHRDSPRIPIEETLTHMAMDERLITIV